MVADWRSARDGNFCRLDMWGFLLITGWHLKPSCPKSLLMCKMPLNRLVNMAAKNVYPKYPPALMIHGTKDTDVPHEQSLIMAREFKKHVVTHRLISVKGGEHGALEAESLRIFA